MGKAPLLYLRGQEDLDHIRAHNLQNPAYKRATLAGDKFKAVFGQDRRPGDDVRDVGV